MDKVPLVKLGDTGIDISALGLGTVKFGRNQGVKYPTGFDLPDMKICSELLSYARDLGVNLIDTAPAYGLSEERLGVLLDGQRHDWVIAGKFGEEFEDGQSAFDFSPAHCLRSVERSLQRLNTDYLDILLIHSDGNDMDILSDDDLIKTLTQLKTSGKVRAIGASTKTKDGGIKALSCMDVVMATYTPVYEDERAVLDYACDHNKGVILKKVLASGHLDQIGNEDPVQAAMNFAFDHKGVSSVITGTLNKTHLLENARAVIEAFAR